MKVKVQLRLKGDENGEEGESREETKARKRHCSRGNDDGIIGNLRLFRVPNISKSLSSFLFIFKRVTY